MSIRQIAQVWAKSNQKGSALLLLLAIADYANDEGEAWPSVQSLAEKARLSERATQRAIRKLETDGEVKVTPNAGAVPTSHSGYRTTLYQLVVEGANLTPRQIDRVSPASPNPSVVGSSIPLLSLEEQSSKAVQQLEPQSLLDLWNEIVKEPCVLKLTPERRKKAKLRLETHRDPDFWRRVLEGILKTPFLRGDNDHGWRADFDWLIRNDENAVRVLEEKYHKRRFEKTAEDRKREIMDDLARQRAEGRLS